MNEEILQTIRDTIKETVNGKIDSIEEKLDEHNEKHEADMVIINKHLEETRPIIEAYRGFNTAGNLIKWLAGVGTAIGVLWIIVRTWITGK